MAKTRTRTRGFTSGDPRGPGPSIPEEVERAKARGSLRSGPSNTNNRPGERKHYVVQSKPLYQSTRGDREQPLRDEEAEDTRQEPGGNERRECSFSRQEPGRNER